MMVPTTIAVARPSPSERSTSGGPCDAEFMGRPNLAHEPCCGLSLCDIEYSAQTRGEDVVLASTVLLLGSVVVVLVLVGRIVVFAIRARWDRLARTAHLLAGYVGGYAVVLLGVAL